MDKYAPQSPFLPTPDPVAILKTCWYRQKLSAAKKVLDGERQIADEVEGQLRKTVVIYEQQLDRENAAKTHLENDISRTTEVCLTEVGWSLRLFYFAVTQ